MMMSLLGALHVIAARRGEGLRPELARLGQHWESPSRTGSAATSSQGHGDLRADQFGSDLAPQAIADESATAENCRLGQVTYGVSYAPSRVPR